MKRLLLIAAVVLALGAGSAEAGGVGIGQARIVERPVAPVVALISPSTLQEDIARAAAYWQVPTPPACASMFAEYADLPPDSWGNATTPPAGWFGPCFMRIVRGLSARDQCLVVTHEYGHWLGLAHDPSDPSNPMYFAGPHWALLPLCEALDVASL